MSLRWPAILPFLLAPGRRRRADRAAADDVNWRRFPVELPHGLELQWLGTAGFRLAYQGTTLIIDPYLSRAPFGALARRRVLLPHPDPVARYISAADAVLVGHSHFDHVVDVPLIAQRYGARVYGSESTRRLLALHGLSDLARVPEPYRVVEIGPFRVTFVPSVHSRLVLGLKVPYDGEITCEHLEDLTGPAYRCGQVYGIHIAVAGVTFYHQGSCNLVDDAIRHRHVDYFLAGIAGRGFTERYWERILGRLEPRFVVPHHHDNFFLPLDQEMGFSFNVNFARFLEEVAAVSQSFAIRALEPLQSVAAPEA